ncbi:MAG: RAMP superfamily CRISPR-associated protein [Eubacteriales bacterium]|nr:RAMP superfamily CRISPR-associated protein [Eubacteriales bacterium]
MSSYLLKIELKSDMCVSDGGVYNSSLDTDICHDEYGFPYIPAKRIKGCLRECAEELREWGMELPLEEMFGKTDRYGSTAAIRIGNARLQNYEKNLEYVRNASGNPVFHPQNVLNHFSYVRFQTSLDSETGSADPTSLRSMRVAKKGLVFEAQIEMDEKYQKEMEICCNAFTSIGIARTRGLGEISTSLIQQPKEKEECRHAAYVPGAVRLDYELYLEEPVICKSVNGGEARTLDYIEGSKLLGLIAQELRGRRKDFMEFMAAGELFCSNAYPAWEGKRCVEVPATLYSIKNEEDSYVDQLYPLPKELKEKQMNRMKHCYIRMDAQGNLKKGNVNIEERYHHRRPEDKSIGRVAKEVSSVKEADRGETEGSQFYQMSSIEAGQSFRGYVIGSEDQIRQVYDCLTVRETFYMGYSRSAEYGRTRIRITDTSCRKEEKKVMANEWIVKLEAPTIVYNDRAFYSTDIRDLDAEIRAALKLPGDIQPEVKPFVCYTSVGGYNVTWGARKPIVEAFDKGTVLCYHLNCPVELELPEILLLGERVSEGFGEATLRVVDTSDSSHAVGSVVSFGEESSSTVAVIGDSEFAESICDELFEDYVRTAAIEDVKALPDKGGRNCSAANGQAELAVLKTPDARPTISNMLLMCMQSSSFADISWMTEERYGKKSDKKKEKLKIADTILEQVEKRSTGLTDSFCEAFKISRYSYDTDRCKWLYLTAYLQQLKYVIRKKEKHGKGGGQS